jgi:glycosyltransferase involved in cell wall biosynthesis
MVPVNDKTLITEGCEGMVSVLMPAYRAARTIKAAVDSVLCCQTAEAGRLEVVIAPDDGDKVYEGLFANDARVVVLKASCGEGPGASRNRAKQASRGRWITMLDADDTVTPGYVDELLKLAAGNKNSVAYSRTRYVNLRGGVVRELPASHAIDVPGFVAFAGSIHPLYCRSLWVPYAESVAEDVIVDAMLLEGAGGLAPLSMAVYVAQLHDDSLCARTPQSVFNATYRRILGQCQRGVLLDVFAAKLSMGTLYGEHLRKGGGLRFHEYVEVVSSV